MSNKLYTVTLKGTDTINIVDAEKGVTVNRTRIKGEIINGPIVVGDRFTVVTRQPNGSTMGFIYKLPAGTILNRFNV